MAFQMNIKIPKSKIFMVPLILDAHTDALISSFRKFLSEICDTKEEQAGKKMKMYSGKRYMGHKGVL